jgi:thiamine-phosphate pyrophosphorylase
MSDPSPGLYLVTPVLTGAESFPPALREALAVPDIASVLLRLGPSLGGADAARLVRAIAEPTQATGAALLIDGSPELAIEAGADGVHVEGVGATLDAAIKRLSPRYIVGAGALSTRDDAMTAGEAGADYVLFGDGPDALETPALLERVKWWAEIFNTPCVGLARSLDELGPLVAAGADFVMLGDCVWRDPRGPVAAILDARRAIAEWNA